MKIHLTPFLKNNPATSSGFSLLEVLVAFAIAAAALAVLFRIYGQGATATLLGDQYAEAVAIAESRLAEAGLAGEANPAASGLTESGYSWEVSIQDHAGETPAPSAVPMSLKEVRVDVHWGSGGKPRSIRLATLKPVFES